MAVRYRRGPGAATKRPPGAFTIPSGSLARLPPMVRRLSGVAGLALALGAVAAGACGRGETAAAGAASAAAAPANVVVVAPDSPQLQQLRVEPVGTADVRATRWLRPGTSSPIPTGSPACSSRRRAHHRGAGRLGDRVERGQPVVALESPDADAAVAAFPAGAGDRAAGAGGAAEGGGRRRARERSLSVQGRRREGSAGRAERRGPGAGAGRGRGPRASRRRGSSSCSGSSRTRSARPRWCARPSTGKVLEVNVAPGEYRARSRTATPPRRS